MVAKRKGKSKTTSEKKSILDHLTQDAFAVLKILAGEDENIAHRIERIAREYLSGVDFEDIASEVYFELNNVDVEEVWRRSGRTRHGYVDPTEMAWEMFENALEPFLEELRKYQKLSMYDEAKNYCMGILKGIYRFEKELKVDPDNFGAWNDLGLALGRLGRNEEALNSFDRCIEIDPHIAHSWHNKGNLLIISLGREGEALRCYEEALKRDSQILQAWYNRGAILLSKKMYEDAVKCFDEGIKLNDKYYMAWMAKALALNAVGNIEEYKKCLSKACELNPEFALRCIDALIAGERRFVHTSWMDAKKTKK